MPILEDFTHPGVLSIALDLPPDASAPFPTAGVGRGCNWLMLCIFRELNRGKAAASKISILGLGRSRTSLAIFYFAGL